MWCSEFWTNKYKVLYSSTGVTHARGILWFVFSLLQKHYAVFPVPFTYSIMPGPFPIVSLVCKPKRTTSLGIISQQIDKDSFPWVLLALERKEYSHGSDNNWEPEVTTYECLVPQIWAETLGLDVTSSAQFLLKDIAECKELWWGPGTVSPRSWGQAHSMKHHFLHREGGSNNKHVRSYQRAPGKTSICL